LEGHRAIRYSHRETDWRFQAAGGVPSSARLRLRVNNCMFIRDAALAGLGVALVPSFIVPQELRSGALKALNVGYEPEGADLNIAYPRDRISSAKLLALMRHLRLAFEHLAEGRLPARACRSLTSRWVLSGYNEARHSAVPYW
jgi:DNA-binding transcriptional LysR family regulator